MRFYTIQGTRNKFGWWIGINFIPGKFGLLLDSDNASILSWLKSKVSSVSGHLKLSKFNTFLKVYFKEKG